MDAGNLRQMTSAQTAVAEPRGHHSTNQETALCVRISPELLSSDDEWEMATNEELCESDSSASDLSDIEVLSRSPSKDAVKISAADNDKAVDVCEFENVKEPSFLDDGNPDSCSDPQNVTAALEASPPPQYLGIMGSCEQGPEIAGVKRRHWKRDSVAATAILKERSKGRKTKHTSMGSRKTTKQLSKSKAGPISVAELQIRKSQMVNSASSTDNEEDPSVVRKCSIKKRKRKNKTEKGNCHPGGRHTPVTSESDPEYREHEIVKRPKRRKRDNLGESVRPVCNEISLKQHEVPDCRTAEAFVELKRAAEGDGLAGYTQSEKQKCSGTADQGIKRSRSRCEICDENNIHEDAPCNLQIVPSSEKSKVIPRMSKKVGDNMKHDDTICCMECALNSERLKLYSRKEMDETTKCEITSLRSRNMEFQNETGGHSQTVSNPEDIRTYQLIPLCPENLKSLGKGVTNSRVFDIGEMKYAVIPLSNGFVEYPETTTGHCASVRHIDEHAENNMASCKYKDALSREEKNLRKINNIDGTNKVAKRKRQIGDSSLKPATNFKPLNNFLGKNYKEVYVHSLFDVDANLPRMTRTNSKLTSAVNASGIEDDIVNRLRGDEYSKKSTENSTTPSKADDELIATAPLNERQIPESLGVSTEKLVSQIRIPQFGATDCWMLKTAEEGSEHLVGHGGWKEDRPEMSSGCVWDITSKAAMNSKTPDDCLATARKKCLRKVKSRPKRETPVKLQSAKCGLGLAAILSDSRQMKEIQQTAGQIIPDLAPNGAQKQGSSLGNLEMAEAGLNAGRHHVTCAGSGPGHREKSIFEVSEEPLCVIDRTDVATDGSSVDPAPPSCCQARKEKSPLSKVIHSAFKAKYKCKGRTSICQKYLKRDDICKWRQLRRLLLVNKRRFEDAHGIGSSDDVGTLSELEDAEHETDSGIPGVTTRSEVCPLVAKLGQRSTRNGRSDFSVVDAGSRPTYASVVKGTRQDICSANQEQQKNTEMAMSYGKSYVVFQGSKQCLKNEIEGLTGSEERSFPCYGRGTNTEISSVQETSEHPGFKFESQPSRLAVGDEFSWDFQAAESRNVSAGFNLTTQIDSDVTLGWPFPAALTKTSSLKGDNETGHVDSAIAEKRACDHRIFTRTAPDGVVTSAWSERLPLPEYLCPVIPVEIGTSNKFELSPSQAGQTEVVGPGAAEEDPEIGQHPPTSDDTITDDQPLDWPLPFSKNSPSKFGFGDAPRGAADEHQMSSYELPHTQNLPRTRPVGVVKPFVETQDLQHTRSVVIVKPFSETQDLQHTRPVVMVKPFSETQDLQHTRPVGIVKPLVETQNLQHTRPVGIVKPFVETQDLQHTRSVVIVKPFSETQELQHTRPVGIVKSLVETHNLQHTRPVGIVKPFVETQDLQHTRSVVIVKPFSETQDLQHTRPVGIVKPSVDLSSFSAPMQSQMSIPRIRTFPNSSEIDESAGVSPQDETSEVDDPVTRSGGEADLGHRVKVDGYNNCLTQCILLTGQLPPDWRLRGFQDSDTRAVELVVRSCSAAILGTMSMHVLSFFGLAFQHVVDALEKQLEDLKSLLLKEKRDQLQSGCFCDGVVVPVSAKSVKLKSFTHKHLPKSASKGCKKNLARSSVQTVSVKSKSRIYNTRIARMEEQMDCFREALMNTARNPAKIQVKCKNLHMQICDRQNILNTDQTTDGLITMTLTQQDDEVQESLSRVQDDAHAEKAFPKVKDVSTLEYHIEMKDRVRNESLSRTGECFLDHESTVEARGLGHESKVEARGEDLVQKSVSGVRDGDLMEERTARVQVGTSGMVYRNLVTERLARAEGHGLAQRGASRMGGGLIPENVSNVRGQLQSRAEDSRTIQTTLSSVRNSDLYPAQFQKTVSRAENHDLIQDTLSIVGSIDPVSETSSRVTNSGKIKKSPSSLGDSDQFRKTLSTLGNPDLIKEIPSGVDDRHLEDVHLNGKEEAVTARKTTKQFTALTDIGAVKQGEHAHRTVSRQNANADANHVSFVGIPDVPDLIPTNHHSPRQPYTQLTHLCSCCSSVLHSGHAYAPATRVCSTESESNRFPLASGAAHNRHQDLKMPAHIPDDNNYIAVTSSCDNHRLPISPPDYSSHSPLPRSSCTENNARRRINPVLPTPRLQPATPCLYHRTHPCYQHSRISLSPERQPSISQNRELNNVAHYPEPCCGYNPCVSKHPVHKPDHDLFGDHLRERSSPWIATTETILPIVCCWHSVNRVGNSIRDGNHKKETMGKMAASSGISYVSEREPDLWPTSEESKHSWHIGTSYPDFSLMHHNSGDGSENKSSRQIPSSSPGVEVADSVDPGVNSQNAMDDTRHNGNVIITCPVEEKTKLSGSFRHPVSQTSCIPCFNSGCQQSPDSSAHSCHQGNHENKPCRRQGPPRSQGEFLTTSKHEVCLQNQHYQTPMCHKQHQVPAFEGETFSCPYQACKDSHLLQNNHFLKAQLSEACEDLSTQCENSSQPCPLLSNMNHHFLENDALGAISDNAQLNNTLLSSQSPVKGSEDGFRHNHHLRQANPTVEEVNSTALTRHMSSHRNSPALTRHMSSDRNSPALTRHMSSQRNYCRCCCPVVGCTCKRQIEGSLACLERQPS